MIAPGKDYFHRKINKHSKRCHMLVELNGRKIVVKFEFEECKKVEVEAGKIQAVNNPRHTECRIYEVSGPKESKERKDIVTVKVRNMGHVEFSKLGGKRWAMTKALKMAGFTRDERVVFWTAFKAENASVSFGKGGRKKKRPTAQSEVVAVAQ